MSATEDAIAVQVPDIGDFTDVPVIEILVSVGETVAAEDPLLTLESDKATMDVPSPSDGTVTAIHVGVGDRVSQGSLVVDLAPVAAGSSDSATAPSASADRSGAAQGGASGSSVDPAAAASGTDGGLAAQLADEDAAARPTAHEADGHVAESGAAGSDASTRAASAAAYGSSERAVPAADAAASRSEGPIYASPSVRRLARELGVDLHGVAGTGRKGRITAQDVGAPQRASGSGGGLRATTDGSVTGLELLPWPTVDFEKYGPVERVARSRIQKIAAPNLARNWAMIPHVTQHDEADITDLESWRTELNREQDEVKVTMLAFLVLASVAALKGMPEFNSSLDGDELVLKRYWNIGFAADTPGGLVVPVIKDADRKGVFEIAGDLGSLSAKARAGKLGPAEMSGATFTISSLGGIGGTAFTPIINAPEVAILGASRAQLKPVWDGAAFVPRLMLPLSLSYDHRVIDGAAAARFVVLLSRSLADLRRLLLRWR